MSIIGILIIGLVVLALTSEGARERPMSWRALDASWSAAEHEAFAARISGFQFNPYRTDRQRIWESMRIWCVSRSTRLARTTLRVYEEWLVIVAEYGPQIVAQAKAYEQAFMDWERWNRPGWDYRCPEAIDREHAAVAEANRLQEEVGGCLVQSEFPFRVDHWNGLIAHRCQMDFGDRATVSAVNVERFWEEMQRFLEARVARLRKAVGNSKAAASS